MTLGLFSRIKDSNSEANLNAVSSISFLLKNSDALTSFSSGGNLENSLILSTRSPQFNRLIIIPSISSSSAVSFFVR